MLVLLLALSSLAVSSVAYGQDAVAYGQDDAAPATGALAGSGAPTLAEEDVRREGRLAAWAQIQSRITVWDQDVSRQADPASYGDPEDDPGFGLPRARLGLDGYLPLGDLGAGHQVDWAISVGVGAPYDRLSTGDADLQLVDAFVRWTAPTPIGPSSVLVGQQRVPFNRGSLISSADLLFHERDPGSEWLTPSREIGAVGAQGLELGETLLVLLRAGAFNGNGEIFGDTDPGLLGVARLELAAGDAYRTWSPTLDNALGIGAAVMRNTELATTESAFAVDALARLKVVTLTAELIRNTIGPTDTVIVAPSLPEETARGSLSAQLSVWVPFEEANGLEIGARYATLDDARHLDDLGDVQLLHAGLTWRNPFPGVDLGAGYVHRTETHGGFDNDSIRIWTQVRPRRVLE